MRASNPFGSGLNVLSGETGAGKSILIDALGAVLGDRVSTDMVRTGATTASIDATFDLQLRAHTRDGLSRVLEELEIERDATVLSFSAVRSTPEVAAAPGERSTDNGVILAQIGSLLVDIHGQSEHLSLLKPAAQLQLLDRFGPDSAIARNSAANWMSCERRRARWSDRDLELAERMQRVDLLRYQIEEINRAGLQPGEEAVLAAERARLANADRLARRRRRRTWRSPVATTSTSLAARSGAPASSFRYFESIAADRLDGQRHFRAGNRASVPRRG